MARKSPTATADAPEASIEAQNDASEAQTEAPASPSLAEQIAAITSDSTLSEAEKARRIEAIVSPALSQMKKAAKLEAKAETERATTALIASSIRDLVIEYQLRTNRIVHYANFKFRADDGDGLVMHNVRSRKPSEVEAAMLDSLRQNVTEAVDS